MKMEALKKQRGIIKGSMTKLLTYARGNLEQANIDEIYVKISRVQQLMSEFTEIERLIFAEDVLVASDQSDFEDNFYEVLAKLNATIRKRSLTPPLASQVNNTTLNMSTQQQTDVRLPKIIIPIFDGNYMEWQSFYDIYTSAVHDKDSLTAAQKFQYLKGYIKGEPAALIRHLPITDANYHEAFQKLVMRYDRKRFTINSFINTFMEQPAITQPNSVSIRQMADAFDEVIRGLKALGEEAERRDHWLIYIAIAKLDSATRALWAQETAEVIYPTFDDLLKFLNKRTDTLETERGFNKKVQPMRSARLRTYATTTLPVCPICNQGDHFIYQCDKFKQMTPDERSTAIKAQNRCFNCLSNTHRVYDCRSKKRCQKCQRKHHSALHEAVSTIVSNTPISDARDCKANDAAATLCKNTLVNLSRTILPTAVVNIQDRHGQYYPFKVLLDSASQSSFVSESCFQKLDLIRHHSRVLIKGIGETTIGQSKGTTELHIAPSTSTLAAFKTQAFIIPKITCKRGCGTLNEETTFRDLELADPTFNQPGKIDALLGVDVFAKALQGETKPLSNGLVALKTIFGWVIAGTSTTEQHPETVNCNIFLDIDENLKKFWEVEEIPKISRRSVEEEACEALYKATTTTAEDNRFSVRLPFRKSKFTLGSSFNLAMSRLQSIERKFRANKDFKEQYTKFINEYIQLGHMSRVPGPVSKSEYYLPHHGVLREASSTTKLRVVFDGSAKSTNGLALNDVLMAGPTIQDTLMQILTRFRQHKFALTGDIEKMYRQIWVAETDRHQQNILWRDDSSLPVQRYQLNTLTYGTTSAPFLATRSLQEVGNINLSRSSSAARAILRDFYVDDLMTGASTKEELLSLTRDIRQLLSNHGFNLRKLLSNDKSVQSVLQETETTGGKSISDDNMSIKVLGLSWEPNNDSFNFRCQLGQCKSYSKRVLLSEASKTFDPLGWIAPLTVRVKILFQSLWLQDISWDDELPEPILQSWTTLRDELKSIDMITVPRWLGTLNTISLHGFSDASEKAYGAVVYAVTLKNDEPKSILIAAKTRVAPLKQKSLPRLELMGAVLLSQLMSSIAGSLQLAVTDRILWTDSKIVLDWLSAQPRRWSTFVANRTSEIIENYPRKLWRHVPSAENPADLVSRGTTLTNLIDNKLWWHGPHWLTQPRGWPQQSETMKSVTTIEQRETVTTMNTTTEVSWIEEFIARYRSYYKITRILAIMLRFTTNIKTTKANRRQGNIVRDELIKAEHVIVRQVQGIQFPEEINQISKGNTLPKGSKLRNLNPFKDEYGIIRVGGRIQRSLASFSVKHPIILLNQGHLATAIAHDIHQFHHHAGVGFLINAMRRRFWILGAKGLAKATVHKCIPCFRQNPKHESQIMGNLPQARVVYTYPFHNVGLDYCGPFKVHSIRRRGQIPDQYVTPHKQSPNSRWHVLKQLKHHFWKRWNREYLSILQTRQKWHHTKNNIELGDIVVVLNENLPSMQWALGRVIKTHPGPDGKVRVVTLKVGTGGMIQRPINKICKLPIDIDINN